MLCISTAAVWLVIKGGLNLFQRNRFVFAAAMHLVPGLAVQSPRNNLDHADWNSPYLPRPCVALLPVKKASKNSVFIHSANEFLKTHIPNR